MLVPIGVNYQNNIYKVPRNIDAPIVNIAKSVEGLCYHHAAKENTNHWAIANYHVNVLGWDHVGYHFIIEDDGSLVQVLGFEEKGFHAGYEEDTDDLTKFPNRDPQYYNDHYLSVCLTGDFTNRGPSIQQFETAVRLGIVFVKATIGQGKIVGHRELPGKVTSCPGRLDMAYLRGMVQERSPLGAVLGSESAPIGKGDDPWFRQFKDWRDAAINAKGAADAFGKELEGIRAEIDRDRKVLDDLLKHQTALYERVSRAVGK